MKYIIQKEVEAKSIKEALTKESKAEITYIDKKDAPPKEEGKYNTHAIGFGIEVDPDYGN